MKKNVNVLKNENSILDSYKIDLQNKRSQLINELKHIKKEKEKNNKVDTSKAKDLILEKINKPDLSFINVDDEEDVKDPTTYLANKERIITNFKRYEPIKKTFEKENHFITKEDSKIKELLSDDNIKEIEIINERQDKKDDEIKIIEQNVIEEVIEEVVSIPLAEKERIITRFHRYEKPAIKTINNQINDSFDDNQIIIASPFIEIKEKKQDFVSTNIINEINEIEKNSNYENSETNDIINNENHELNSNLNKQEINDLYPISYQELLKRKNNNDVVEYVDYTNNNINYDDDNVIDKTLFDYTNENFGTVVDWVKYNKKKENKH